MHYAHETLKWKSVISLIHPENDASIAVAKANGLQPDGKTTIFNISALIYRAHFKK